MTDKVLRYPSWQKSVEEMLTSLPPDSAERVQRMRHTLKARLRIMTAADLEERRALEDALQALEVLKGQGGAALPSLGPAPGGKAQASPITALGPALAPILEREPRPGGKNGPRAT